MRRRNILLVVAVAILAFAAWKAAWRYDDVSIPQRGFLGDQVLVKRKIRTHLVTGEVEVLLGSGWTPLAKIARRPDCPSSLSDASCALLYGQP